MDALCVLGFYCDRFSHQDILIEFDEAMERSGEDPTVNVEYLELQDPPIFEGWLKKIRNFLHPTVPSNSGMLLSQSQAPEDRVYHTLLPCGYIVFWKWYKNEKRIEVVAEILEKEKILSVAGLNKIIKVAYSHYTNKFYK